MRKIISIDTTKMSYKDARIAIRIAMWQGGWIECNNMTCGRLKNTYYCIKDEQLFRIKNPSTSFKNKFKVIKKLKKL